MGEALQLGQHLVFAAALLVAGFMAKGCGAAAQAAQRSRDAALLCDASIRSGDICAVAEHPWIWQHATHIKALGKLQGNLVEGATHLRAKLDGIGRLEAQAIPNNASLTLIAALRALMAAWQLAMSL